MGAQNVRTFEYRACRIDTTFAVDFESGGEKSRGLCRNVSAAGICAEFDIPLSIRASGTLTLYHRRSTLQIPAEVSYVQQGQVGLIFQFHSPQEREQMAAFAALIAPL